MPNWTYSVPISTGMLITLPLVHVNFNSSGSVGLVPGLHVVCKRAKYSGNIKDSHNTDTVRPYIVESSQ